MGDNLICIGVKSVGEKPRYVEVRCEFPEEAVLRCRWLTGILSCG